MNASPLGLSNASVYTYCLEKQAKGGKPNLLILVGVIVAVAFAGVYFYGGLFYLLTEGLNLSDRSAKVFSTMDKVCYSVIFCGIVLSVIGRIGMHYEANRRWKKIDAYLLKLPQKQNFNGMMGLENITGGVARKDLLIEGFELQFPKKALKELNFEQLMIVYEACPNDFAAKRQYLHPSFEKIFTQLDNYLTYSPESLGHTLKEIDEQSLSIDPRVVILLIKFLPETHYSPVHPTLAALFERNHEELENAELLETMTQLRGLLRKDMVIELNSLIK